ncbi:MAG: CAP domain-containing protein [bacterium]
MFRKLVLAGTATALVAASLGLIANASQWKSASALTNCSTNTQALDSQEQQLLTLINNFRVANGVGAVKASPTLSRAAAWMSEDLTSHGTFDHTDSLGRSPFTRVKDCGYPSTGAGEILARTSSAQSAFTLWQNSTDGHRENMLNSRWTVAGVGHTGSIWGVDFGAIDDSGQPWDSGGTSATNTPVPTQPGNPTASNTPPGSSSATPTSSPGPGGATPIPGYKLPSSFPIKRAMLPLVTQE